MGLTLPSAIVTIIKATYLPLFTDVEDPLYNVTPLAIWDLIEQNTVIVAACILTLHLFFRRAFELRGSSDRTTSLRSGIKLTSTARSKRHVTATELALQETHNRDEHDVGFVLDSMQRETVRRVEGGVIALSRGSGRQGK
ncbi:hypothetical protein BDW60DRAFT_208763 [Aspergillus nidulans var. acristatus]